jgi:hypothetical protein
MPTLLASRRRVLCPLALPEDQMPKHPRDEDELLRTPPDDRQEWNTYRRTVIGQLVDMKDAQKRIEESLEVNYRSQGREIGELRTQIAVLQTKMLLIGAGVSALVAGIIEAALALMHK